MGPQSQLPENRPRPYSSRLCRRIAAPRVRIAYSHENILRNLRRSGRRLRRRRRRGAVPRLSVRVITFVRFLPSAGVKIKSPKATMNQSMESESPFSHHITRKGTQLGDGRHSRQRVCTCACIAWQESMRVHSRPLPHSPTQVDKWWWRRRRRRLCCGRPTLPEPILASSPSSHCRPCSASVSPEGKKEER